MSENEKREMTIPPALRATSLYTREAREKVIMGLEWALENMVDPTNDFRFAGYDGPCVLLNQPIVSDALALLKALDVTPEELERLKKCRHECKIDCLLEHYEQIKAERDALLEARILTVDELRHLHPHSDVVWLQDVDKYCVKPGILTYLGLNKVEFVVEGRRVPVRAEYVDYMIRWCCWTRMPSEEQRRDTPWRDA